MTTSQESELPIEPTDKFETTSIFEGFDTLSDKNGDEIDLFQRCTRFYFKKETKAREKLKMSSWEKKWLPMESYGKLNSISKKKRQENEKHIESLQIPGSNSPG